MRIRTLASCLINIRRLLVFKNLSLKIIFSWISFILGLVPLKFAYDIYEKLFIPNMVTWFLILILDVVGLWIVYKEGNKRPLIQIAWVVAAAIIMFAILIRQSIWQIGIIEIVSAIACIVAVILWKTTANHHAVKLALIFQTIAVYISFIPQAINYWDKPEPGTWYLWFWSAIGCALAIYSSPKHNMVSTFIPWAALVLNILVLWLVLL